MEEKTKRRNTYFRQTERQFKAEKLNQIQEHFNRNLPYRIYSFSRRQVNRQMSRLKGAFNKVVTKIPKGAKRIG